MNEKSLQFILDLHPDADVIRVIEESGCQVDNGRVADQDGGIGNPVLAPMHQFLNLELGYGGQFVLGFADIALLEFPV